MISKRIAENILRTFGEAWTNQDSNKILTIFTKDAIYHERVLKKPYKGHKEIKEYWQSKVVEEQSDIKFKLLKYYICDNTIIAEWDASFNSNIEKKRIHIQEVAIFEIEKDKIKSLREYWHSERVQTSK